MRITTPRETQPVELRAVEAGALRAEAAALLAGGGRMQMAYAWCPPGGGIELRYLASRNPREPFLLWCCRPEGTVPSLAPTSPLLGWYEREITDLFGQRFAGHPEPHPLVLRPGAAPVVPPLDPAYPADQPMPFREGRGPRLAVDGPDIQELPFGPVRADVVEWVELVFHYVGEHILHLEPQLFYKHRGMEKRFEGRTPLHGTILAERVSGVGSLAHALAYCQAVEQAADCEVPPRAKLLRALLAELERLYNHLHYFGRLADTTTLKVGQAEGKLLEERVKQINARLTGSRFLRGLLAPGGLRRDLAPEGLAAELAALSSEFTAHIARLEATNSYLDRLMTTGVLTRTVAFDQGATSPVERASGFDRDLRRDHPYAGYEFLSVPVPTQPEGDACARARVRAQELGIAVDIVVAILGQLEPGPVRADCPPAPDSEGLGWAESPRGSLFYAVHLGREGQLARVKIKSPSFSNWRAFPFTVHDTNMMDYAINEASFGMTVAGCDR